MLLKEELASQSGKAFLLNHENTKSMWLSAFLSVGYHYAG